jgi:uncharacterized protein YcbK (DUF882 family)
MQLSKNFNKSEFDSKDGEPMPVGVLNNVLEVAQNLQKLRDYYNVSIKINSGYRSEAHNKAVGGSKGSQHRRGLACDIVINGVDPDDAADKIEELIEKGYLKEGGVGRYHTFTHYDIRGTKARWDYR